MNESDLIAIEWKDEDEIDGVAVGPTYKVFSDDTRKDVGWQAKPNAQALAKSLGVSFEEG